MSSHLSAFIDPHKRELKKLHVITVIISTRLLLVYLQISQFLLLTYFSLMDHQFHFLTPYHDLVQFVRLCGFFLVSKAFLFQHPVPPVVNGSLARAISPVLGMLSKWVFFVCHLTFSFPPMVVTFLGKFSILLKAIVI